jgi:hypothetical protein
MFEVIGCDGSRGCEFDGRVARGKKQSRREVAQATKVVNGERDQGDVVGVQGLNDQLGRGGIGSSSMKFGANACKVGPGNKRDVWVGLLGKVALGNMRDCNVNANCNGAGAGRCEEINRDIEGWAAGLVWNLLGRLALDIVLRAGKISEGGQLLKDHKKSVSDMVVERGLEAFREATGE